MAYSRGVSEGSILFYSGGHNHNGTSSALIATEAYSIYDFIVGFAGSNERQIKQQNNFNNLKTVISNVIKTDVLGPSGVRLSPNSIETIHIVTGAVTAEELSANIVLINNVIRSNNFDGTVLANGAITAAGTVGWAVSGQGQAVFDTTFIRGSLVASSVSTPGIDIDTNGNLTSNANTFGIYANGAIFTSSNNFRVDASGNLTASNATISGTVTASSVSTPGIDILSDGSISSANFNVTAGGNITATNVNITGAINATSGSIDGDLISGGTISGVELDIGANFYVDTSGNLYANNADITGSIHANDGSIGAWSIDADGIYNTGAGGRFVALYPAVGTVSETVFEVNYLGWSATISASTMKVQTGAAYSTLFPGSISTSGSISVGGDIVFYGNDHLYTTYVRPPFPGNTGEVGIIGSGWRYYATNLVQDGFPMAFGWRNSGGRLTFIVNNDTNVTGTISNTITSDRRVKNNIRDISAATLDAIYSINTYEFDWNEKAPQWLQDRISGIGVIADELKNIYPEAVIDDNAYEGWVHRYSEHPEGFSLEEMQLFGSDLYEFVSGEGVWKKPQYATVDYAALVPHLISVIKDLNNRVKELESKV